MGQRRIGALLYIMISLSALGGMAMPTFSWGQASAPPPSDKPISPAYFGMHFHRADAGTPWPGPGIGAWRLIDAYVSWFHLQPEKDRWEFQKLDRYVDMAKLTGVDLLLPLAFTPRWAALRPNEKSAYGLGAASEPKEMADWKNYVRTVAQRYKGKITAYEIWNEPEARIFFSGTPESLVKMQKEAYEIIKSIDPDATVVSSAVTGGNPKSLEWFRQYIAAGGGHYADVIGYHFYFTEGEPEHALDLAQRLRAILNQAGVNKPIWNTEAGWQIANEDGSRITTHGIGKSWKLLDQRQAASYVIRALLLTRFAGVERYYWYSWDHKGMGLMEPATRLPKLAGRVYLALAERLAGGKITGCQREGAVWQCSLLDKNRQKMTALWTSDGKRATVIYRPEWGDELWRPVDESYEKISSAAPISVTSEPIFFSRSTR